jgi:hypothetical protein
MLATTITETQPGASRGNRVSEIGAVAVGSVILVSIFHLYYGERISSAANAEFAMLRALALHLDATGARFYGASWCAACTDQKALFGEAAPHLPYVECTAEARREPQLPECRAARIERYPTWIIGHHRHEGLLDIEVLATLSGFLSSESPPARDPTVEESAAPARSQ